MCIFTGPVEEVSDTRIFARTISSPADTIARQALVYAMSYRAAQELAMILPLPTPPGAPDDALRFLDFSDYEDFFEDLAEPFQEPRSGFIREHLSSLGIPRLAVHDVGSFEASFVPCVADFSRLDPRFQLTDEIWGDLPAYADYGFAVFKLKPGAKSVHPMAFEFPRRSRYELFFPTVHVHDGRVPQEAPFHHSLYCQSSSRVLFWTSSGAPAKDFVDTDRTHNIVDGDMVVWKRDLRGNWVNQDTVISD